MFKIYSLYLIIVPLFLGNAKTQNESVLEIPEDEVEKPKKPLIVIEGYINKTHYMYFCILKKLALLTLFQKCLCKLIV